MHVCVLCLRRKLIAMKPCGIALKAALMESASIIFSKNYGLVPNALVYTLTGKLWLHN